MSSIQYMVTLTIVLLFSHLMSSRHYTVTLTILLLLFSHLLSSRQYMVTLTTVLLFSHLMSSRHYIVTFPILLFSHLMSSRHYRVTLTISLLLFSHLMLAIASWDGYDCYFPLERGIKIKQNFLERGAGSNLIDTRMDKARIGSDPWLQFPSQTSTL